jgi:uncharacterized protein YoxC
MSPLAQGIIVACLVVVSVALVACLLAVKRAALRAESVLHLAEREIRPLVSQLESVAAELRPLLHNANRQVDRLGGVVERLDDASVKLGRFVGAVSALTRVGQYAGVARGVARGLDVFISRLKNRSH